MRAFRTLRSLFLALMSFAMLVQSNSTGAQSAASGTLPAPPHPKQIHVKHVLVIGQTKGVEHDSVSATMAAVYNLGKEGGM